MYSIADVSGDELRASAELRDEIYELLRPSYVDPRALLSRELAECTHGYLARGLGRELLCFFLTTRHTLDVQNERRAAVHLGLSASREGSKGRGHVIALYRRCLLQSLEWKQRLGHAPILWSTTASPIVYRTVARTLHDAQPRLDGSFTASGALLAQVLRRHLGATPADADGHPFVLKAVASNTRYSECEVQRLQELSRVKHFDLFARLGVDEARQDRLLFIAGLPDAAPLR